MKVKYKFYFYKYMDDKEEIIIFKNDAVGDLTHSLAAINLIIKNNQSAQTVTGLLHREII